MAYDKDFDKVFHGEKVDKPVDRMYLYDIPSIASNEVEEAIRKVKHLADKHVDEYNAPHTSEFKPFNCKKWVTIKVLEFLNDKPWNDVALGYINALRPSTICVTTGITAYDLQLWRVTVYVNDDNIIQEIVQEVEVGFFSDRV